VIEVAVLADPADPSLRRLETARDVARFSVSPDATALFAQVPDAEVLFYCAGGRAPFEAAFLGLPRLRWVHSRWAGLDGLWFPALRESDLPVTNSRGVFSRTLAEFALLAILYFSKDVPRLVRQQAQGRWEPFAVEELHGRSLGILGYGDIGREVARRARAFGLRILAVRRDPAPDGLCDRSFQRGEVREMVAASDYVVLALPLTEGTRGLFGAAEIAALKPGAVLVNVGRGATVDEPALVAALQAGRLRAGLDVFAEEPLPAESPLWRLDNVLLSPHTADRTETWLDEATAVFVANLRRFAAGQPLQNVVDKRKGY
jgi:phosphoglycerate dehydrogenase-like enzyme